MVGSVIVRLVAAVSRDADHPVETEFVCVHAEDVTRRRHIERYSDGAAIDQRKVGVKVEAWANR